MSSQRSDSSFEMLQRLVEVCAPNGGDVVACIEAYFDESESPLGRKIVSLGGYVYEKSAASKMAEEWSALTDEFDIPFVRMTALAAGSPPYQALDRVVRLAIAKKAAGLIGRHASYGISFVVEEDAFAEAMVDHWFFKNAYTFGFFSIMREIANWLNQVGEVGEVAYFFESGNKKQNEIASFINSICENEALRRKLCLAGHSYVNKSSSGMIQSGDFFAWSTGRVAMNSVGFGVNEDFVRAVDEVKGVKHKTIIAESKMISKTRRYFKDRSPRYPVDSGFGRAIFLNAASN